MDFQRKEELPELVLARTLNLTPHYTGLKSDDGKSEHLDLFVYPMQKDLQHVADVRTSAMCDDDVRLCTRICLK